MKVILAALAMLSLAQSIDAATINAASCSVVDVQAAVNTANTNDLVLVPACAVTWTTGITVSGKDITIQCAGNDSTVVTFNADGLNIVNLTNTASRLTQCGFVIDSGDNNFVLARGPGYRIDRNRFTSTGAARLGVYSPGDSSSGFSHPGGLIDNNTFIAARVLVQGDTSGSPIGTSIWTAASTIGATDQSGIVYVEDNTSDNSGISAINFVDANYSGRYVVRFNTFTSSYVEAHSLSGGNQRGTRSWEIYQNTLTLNAISKIAFIRAGTGMIFNNTATATDANSVEFDNERSFENPFPTPANMCDGNSTWDGNTVGQNGWWCRDQIGRGVDDVGTFPQPQASEPAYVWDNTVNGVQTNPTVVNCTNAVKTNGSCADIVSDRDFYQKAASFNGTSGIGSGVVASRPSTCTVGVGYWATDEGSWNKRPGGVQGRLYRCTATNIWTLVYTPYIYPHPLQNFTSGVARPSVGSDRPSVVERPVAPSRPALP